MSQRLRRIYIGGTHHLSPYRKEGDQAYQDKGDQEKPPADGNTVTEIPLITL